MQAFEYEGLRPGRRESSLRITLTLHPGYICAAVSPSPPAKSPTRAIVFLAVAGFASQAMVRSADSLLPQIATDLAVSVGAASIIVSAYTVMHGSMQLITGPVGDRFEKYQVIAVATALCGVAVMLCGFAQTLPLLTLARVASGACAAWIIPLGMAYIGDVTPYERRQQVLGRYLSGQITGQLFGQAAGGVIGDLFGWRAMFFVLAAIFALAALALFRELAVNPATRVPGRHDDSPRSLIGGYSLVLASRWARIVMLAVAVETALAFGAFAYVGADLHLRFGLSFTLVGLVVGAFGVGGLIYALAVKWLVGRLGQSGLARYGSLMLGLAYLTLAFAPAAWLAPLGVTLIGLGFYMLHNTLQTNATQMTPQARGTAVALFSAAVYLGQTAGVALAAPIVDRAGAAPLFVIVAILLPLLGMWFAAELKRRAPL
jgi:MFS transporter, YNFM family, putative membrane transport protein